MIAFAFFYSPTIDDKVIIGANPGNQFSITGVANHSRLSLLIGCLGALGPLLTIVSLLPSSYVVHTYLQFTFFYLVVVEARASQTAKIS